MQDSNLRRQKPSDLQSDPFDRSGNSPVVCVGTPLLACVAAWMSGDALFRSLGTPESLSRDPDDAPSAVAAFGGRNTSDARPAPDEPSRERRQAELAAGVEPATC